MSPSWLGFTVTHLWKHDLYPLCFSLSRSWSSVASTGRWIKLQVKRSLFSSSSNVSGPFAHGPALSPSFLVPLSLAPLMLLSAQLHSVCAPTCHHVPAGALSLRSCTRENCTRTRTVTNWWWRAGGWHEPKTAHCILTEWGIKSSLSFSISSAEMQSLDSSVTVLQGFENITRA